MKKVFKSPLFYTAIFIISILSISRLLDTYNYQFLNWVAYSSMSISLVGIIWGTYQLLKNKKRLCTIICVLQFAVISLFDCVFCFTLNTEEIVMLDDTKMIKETHSVLFSNWIKYYEYQNPFIRSKQERISEAHDDSIGEYLYTIYYDENGKVIGREEK